MMRKGGPESYDGNKRRVESVQAVISQIVGGVVERIEVTQPPVEPTPPVTSPHFYE